MYRNGGLSLVAASVMAFSSRRSAESVPCWLWSRVSCFGRPAVAGSGQRPEAGTKKPLTQEGPPCCGAFSASARPGKKQEDSGHVGSVPPPAARPPPTIRRRRLTPLAEWLGRPHYPAQSPTCVP
ncbi:hypothetical protein GCM10011608_23600 [Micromonospora sonchi]|uniref:Uncharacterized protein n=1 Tax=Micromonospora sonchi TaxID=1763543 RepID=A0A917TUI1_9ACTN|nr:hypothetical protein GCM10011608_23600 [Micromonospora sonchi]